MKLLDLAPLIEREEAVDVRVTYLSDGEWHVAIHLWIAESDGGDWDNQPAAEGRSGDLGVAISDAVTMALRVYESEGTGR
jgi:hypothetical protein